MNEGESTTYPNVSSNMYQVLWIVQFSNPVEEDI